MVPPLLVNCLKAFGLSAVFVSGYWGCGKLWPRESANSRHAFADAPTRQWTAFGAPAVRSDASWIEAFEQAQKSQKGAAAELMRRLAVSNRVQFASVMAALARSAPEDASLYVLDSALPMEVCQTVADALDPEHRNRFLKACTLNLIGGSFERIEAFGRLFPPTALSEEVAQLTAAVLLSGTADAFSRWAAALPPKKAAALLDEGELPQTDIRTRRIDQSTLRQNWLIARLALPDPPREELLQVLSGLAWRVKDTAVLYQLAERMPEAFRVAARTIADEAVFDRQLRQSPRKALDFCETKGAEFAAAHQQKILQAQSGYAASDLMALLEATTDPAAKCRLLATAAGSTWDFADTSLQAKVCLDLMKAAKDPAIYGKEVAHVLSAVTAVSSKAGMDLLNQLPAPLRAEATTVFIQKWAEHEPAAAAEWIATAPLGSAHDAVISALVASSHDDPEAAFANASFIGDSTLRRDTVREVLRAWRETAPGPVLGLLEKSTLSREEVAALAKEFPLVPR